MHKPISFKDVSLYFSNKICFENFTTQIHYGSRIAIIGRNGSGKSSLLKALSKKLEFSEGEINFPDDVCSGYVEQTISDYDDLSGGQRLNKCLVEALLLSPNLLLLDEPTNHLDDQNRKNLIRMLKNYQGTLVIVSHDKELLRSCADIIWHIDEHKIYQFYGLYDEYVNEIKRKRVSMERELFLLNREKKVLHQQLMQEQNRASKSKAKGKKNIDQRKWPTVVSKAKASRASHTSGKRKSAIDERKSQISNKISSQRLSDIIIPKFSLASGHMTSDNILLIRNAQVGYSSNNVVLKNLYISLSAREKISLNGRNGSGKSTLLKAILDRENIHKSGLWYSPGYEDIGYLDQHYSDLDENQMVIEHLHKIRPDWDDRDVRRHLSDFLFRTNDEVHAFVRNLSGGEKARLSLSLISAKVPKLLLLDEINNNLDLETKRHVLQVLKEYPSAMIIISHDKEFIKEVGVNHNYVIKEGDVSLATF